MKPQHYTPSGRLPFAAFPYALMLAAATLPGAWIYAFPAVGAPFLVRPFFTLLFGVYLGVCTGHAAKKAKVRNPLWMGRLGLVIGFVGWYFHWTAYSAMVLRDWHLSSSPVLELFITMLVHPDYLIAVAAKLFDVGSGTTAGFRLDGWILIFAWLAELACLLGLSHLYGRSQANEPFCEASNSWAKKIEVPGKFAFVKDAEALSQHLTDTPDQLCSVLPLEPPVASPSFSKITIYRCPDGENGFLSIENTEAIEILGKVKQLTSTVINLLKLSGANIDALIRGLSTAPADRKDETDSSERPTPPELLPALEHFEFGRYQEALDIATSYTDAEGFDLRIDAVRLSALATAHLGHWREALSYWDRLFRDEQNAHNALQIATAAVMAGDLERGEAWLARALKMNEATGEIKGPLLLTNFVTALSQSGQMRAAMPYLEKIKEIYTSLGITDSTFLYIRDVPFFSAFLDNSAPVIRGALSLEEGRSWYTSMLPHLDENGREELTSWLETKFAQAAGAPGTA